MNLEDLNRKFGRPGLRFVEGNGGLVRADVDTPTTKGELYLHGAHCAAWQPAGHAPVLWMSKSSYFESGKPIRGGVPICFPWFGPNATDRAAPAHGTARISEWDCAHVESSSEGGLALELSRTIAPFQLQYRVEFGKTLSLSLRTQLTATHATPETFEDALHTYFAISDIRSVSIRGLESTEFIDKMDNAARKPASGHPIQFQGETDRVYLKTEHACFLDDAKLGRTIIVSKSGSQSTVVWNPWIDKAARMPDFGDHEWPEMVCIETANVGESKVRLEPGQSHITTAVISVQ